MCNSLIFFTSSLNIYWFYRHVWIFKSSKFTLDQYFISIVFGPMQSMLCQYNVSSSFCCIWDYAGYSVSKSYIFLFPLFVNAELACRQCLRNQKLKKDNDLKGLITKVAISIRSELAYLCCIIELNEQIRWILKKIKSLENLRWP